MSEQGVPAPARTHHENSPSKLNYIDDCAGFTSKDSTSEAAEEGTFLHDLMEKMITQVIKGRAPTTLEQVSGWVIKSFELSDDQIEYLRFCCKRVDAFLAKKPTAIHVESKVRAKTLDGKEFNSGYLDVRYVFPSIVILQDFKFGWEPVRPASTNLQGINYAVATLQEMPNVPKVGVEFVQPKLLWVSSAVFTRAQVAELLTRMTEVVERKNFVKAHPEEAHKYLKVGGYCRYCANVATCVAQANHKQLAAAKYQDLPMPPSFKGMTLTKPEDVALLRYWVDVIENGLDEVKKKAFELAEQNGGSISCTLPNGEQVIYEIQERRADRSLGNAIEVAEALKEFVTPEEILGAADLAITKLEAIAKNAVVTLAAAEGRKLSKKAAWEQVSATLEAQGLLTRSDTKIRFLKQRKSQQETKQIEKV